METTIVNTENQALGQERRGGPPQRIGEILAELLVQYETRFPETHVAAAVAAVAA